MQPTAAAYRSLLLDHIVPFWFRHGVDHEYGGILSCMTEDGERISTDKYVWSQARWLWVVSALYNRIEQRPEFLESARATANFLRRHAQTPDGKWYFAVTRTGDPVIGPTSVFSDCFAVYGLSEYYRATKDEEALAVALATFNQIRERVEQPGFNEVAPATLPPNRRPHAIPMILTEVANELAITTGDRTLDAAADEYAERVLNFFLRPDRKVVLEYLDANYQPVPPPEGTAVEPGHAIESMWFLAHWARRRNRPDALARAIESIRWHCEAGWDHEYGGLFLAIDADGQEPYIANADKKIWWVHTEALYALLLAHEVTKEPWCLDWYAKVADYSERHFWMPETGEWRQRLDRQGRPITELIALPVKDPFHLPRAVILAIQLLESA